MIIAEVGLNHLGIRANAQRYIHDLLQTDIDAITFQVREPEYYKLNPGFKLLSRDYINICSHIQTYGKKFGIAIADIDQIDFFETLNVDFYKVIRNDMLNDDLIKKLIKTNKKIIVSTGTCSMDDIQIFIDKFKNNNIILNHTQISYDVKDCNLKAIDSLKSKFGVNVSYGNHCSNHNVLYMAVAYQPSDILFYVKQGSDTLPDDKHAIQVADVSKVVNNLKSLNQAIGLGIKTKMEIKIK